MSQNVPPSNIVATAKAPAGVVTGEKIAQSQIPMPGAAVTEERAVGTANVDTAFLQKVQPNLSGVQQAMERASIAESERASQQAAAQAALQQAGLLMAKSQAKEREAQLATQAARQQVLGAESQLARDTEVAASEREAMAARAKSAAELEAQAAARKKAEEAASIEAARLAAAEAAEADAMMKAANLKKQEALKQLADLQGRAAVNKEEAAAATKRAADLTAQAEAHHREAELAREQLGKARLQLAALERQTATTGVGVGAPLVAGAAIGSSKVESEVIGVTKDRVAVAPVPTAEYRPLPTFAYSDTQPTGQAPFNLVVKIAHLQLPPGITPGLASVGMAPIPAKAVIRMRQIGSNLESRSDRALDIGASYMWNLEGSLPVFDPNQLLEIAVLDGTMFDSMGIHSFRWDDDSLVLGRLFLKISALVDGHISTDNRLKLDGRLGGGLLHCILQMQRVGGVASAAGVGGTAGSIQQQQQQQQWQRGSYPAGVTGGRNYWQLQRQQQPYSGGVASGGVPSGGVGSSGVSSGARL